jgi:hypothetical protein
MFRMVDGSGEMAFDAIEATALKVAIRGDGQLTSVASSVMIQVKR